MTSSRRPPAEPRVPAASPAREPARAGPASRPAGADDLFGAGEDEFAAAADALGVAEPIAPVACDDRGATVPEPGARPELDVAPTSAPDCDLDLDIDVDVDVDMDEETPAATTRVAPAAAAAPPAPAAAGAAPPAPWPSAVPDGAEAADALARALAGEPPTPGTPLEAAVAAVAALTPLERSVLGGEPHPIDPAPVQRAAVMRVRVHAALATPPTAGSPLDAGALSALFGEIDALLSDLRTLAEDAPADLHAPLEAVRGAFVRETLRLSAAARAAGPRRA